MIASGFMKALRSVTGAEIEAEADRKAVVPARLSPASRAALAETWGESRVREWERTQGSPSAALTKEQMTAAVNLGVKAAVDRVLPRVSQVTADMSSPRRAHLKPKATAAQVAALKAKSTSLMVALMEIMRDQLTNEAAGEFGERAALIAQEELQAAARRVVERLAAELAA